MKTTTVAALAALAALATAPAFAQASAQATTGASATAAAPAPAAAGAPSIDSTPIEELAAKPETKAILDRDLPGLTSHPAYDQFKGMTLKQLQPMSQGALTDAQLAQVQSDLAKIGK
jgi:hypothetical protein